MLLCPREVEAHHVWRTQGIQKVRRTGTQAEKTPVHARRQKQHSLTQSVCSALRRLSGGDPRGST